jgi:hypothetical protein
VTCIERRRPSGSLVRVKRSVIVSAVPAPVLFMPVRRRESPA